MKVAVFDTYVKRSNGDLAHFDIIVPKGQYKHEEILDFGRQYLESINEKESQLTSEECQFCHIETPTQEIVDDILQKGYYILVMEDVQQSSTQS